MHKTLQQNMFIKESPSILFALIIVVKHDNIKELAFNLPQMHYNLKSLNICKNLTCPYLIDGTLGLSLLLVTFYRNFSHLGVRTLP